MKLIIMLFKVESPAFLAKEVQILPDPLNRSCQKI